MIQAISVLLATTAILFNPLLASILPLAALTPVIITPWVMPVVCFAVLFITLYQLNIYGWLTKKITNQVSKAYESMTQPTGITASFLSAPSAAAKALFADGDAESVGRAQSSKTGP